MSGTLGAYWWRGGGVQGGIPNFGDRLAPLLLAYHADLPVRWAALEDADVVCTGSILDYLPPRWNGYVVGSGKLREHSRPDLSHAQVLALRGPLTAQGVRGDYALGDPGLLAGEMIELPVKEFDLGIVPHWSDSTLADNPTFARYHPLIIDPRDEPLEVVRQIASCKKIVSSSLHGIIVADSFAIPRRFEYTPRFDREGGTFKFRDYSLSIHTPWVVGKTIEANRFGVDDCRFALHDAFRELASRVRA
jgi:hypothetical protein